MTDAERIAQLERQVAELSAQLEAEKKKAVAIAFLAGKRRSVPF